MATATQPSAKLHTASDLERLDAQGLRYELMEGELRKMSPIGGTHGSSTLHLASQVLQHVTANGLGECFASEVGVFLARNPDTVLAPDFAFIATGRLPAGIPSGYLTVIPDLIFETRSPGDTKREIEEKMARWLAAGVRLAWDIDPKSHTVTVYQPGAPAATLGVDDTLAGGGILPGFSLPVRAIFRDAAAGR